MKILIRTNLFFCAFILCFGFNVNAEASTETTKLLDKLSNALDSSGITHNINKPEAWQDQLGGFATGGSIHARVPSSDLQLIHIDLPSMSAGCGGIDLFGGGFGYIDSEKLEVLIKNIGTSAASYAVMLTIKSLSPVVSDLLESLESVSRFMNSQNINTCQIGASMAAGLFPKTQAAQNLACQSRTMGTPNSVGNAAADFFTARYECQDSTESRKRLDAQKEDGLLGANYNLVWKALDKGLAQNSMSQADKEFLMTLSGTLIVRTDNKGNSKFEHKNSLIKDPKLIKAIVYGEAPQDMEFYKCKDVTGEPAGQCLEMGKIKHAFKAENAVLFKVRSLLNSITDKIINETKSKNPNTSGSTQSETTRLNAAEMHLATTTSIPIIKLISLNAGLKGHGVGLTIEDYAESVAFDFVIGYLDSLIDFVYEAVGNLEYAQMEGTSIQNFKGELRLIKQALMEDRVRISKKLNTILSVKQNIKQIESMVINQFGEYRS